MKPIHARAGGFTLLELLVVMALLSVVMLALGAALRTIAQSEDRIDRRLTRTDEFRVATAFMRTTLGRVSDRKVVASVEPGAGSVLFAGNGEAVAWVGVMPARYGAGGRNFFRLAVETVDGAGALVLRFIPWSDVATFPDWSQAEMRVLVTDVTSLAIKYEDAFEVPSVWGPEWPFKDRLPQRVELTVQTAAGFWPSLVVAMRPMPSTQNSGGIVIGGS